MKLAIATDNPNKIKGISNAFRSYFPEVELQIESAKVESGVGKQPVDNDVFIGAKNRLAELKTLVPSSDYFISCESGLLKQYGIYYNVQIVLIEKEGFQQIGISPAFPIPEEYIDEIINTELGEVFDKIFEGKGGVSILTHYQTNRIDLIKYSTLMALSGFNWK